MAHLLRPSLFALVLFVMLSLVYARKKSGSKNSDSVSTTGKEMDSMICPPCDRLFCTVRKASKLNCKGGVTTDICGCCPVCAKLLGEPCGGEWNYLGKCDKGLYCEATNRIQFTSYGPIKSEVPDNGLPEGKCVQIVEDRVQGDSSILNRPSTTNDKSLPHTTKCEPKCTPDFCMTNPKAICSAIDVVDMKRDCHGQCQHTSCRACSWVNPEPDCGACSPDDYRCIKRFAKCIKRDYCSRQKFPCKTNVPSTKLKQQQCERVTSPDAYIISGQ